MLGDCLSALFWSKLPALFLPLELCPLKSLRSNVRTLWKVLVCDREMSEGLAQ